MSPLISVISPEPRWKRKDLEEHREWRIALPQDLLLEFKSLLKFNKQKELHSEWWKDLRKADLASAKMLNLYMEQAIEKFGFVLVTGFPTTVLSQTELEALFGIVCQMMGRLDFDKGPFYEVFDREKGVPSEGTRFSDTRWSHGFHTDSTARDLLPDIVAMLCIHQAECGGETRIVNANEVHEQLRQEYPELLNRLYLEMIRDTRTPSSDTSLTRLFSNQFSIYTFDQAKHRLTFRYMRYWIELGHLRANSPLEYIDIAALDALDEVLNNPANFLQFKMAEGDALFLDNRVIAHDRTKFQDVPGYPKRLILRAWLMAENNEKLFVNK